MRKIKKNHRIPGILALAFFCLGTLSACGGGGSSISLAERELELGRHVVKGMLPDWPDHPRGYGYALSEDFDDISDVVKLSVRFLAHGGTGYDQEKLMEELKSKKQTEMEIGVPELVKDIYEIKPGVWSFVVMREGFTVEGESEYTIHVLHLPEVDDEPGLLCQGQARFDHAKKWQEIESILAGITYSAK